MTKPITLTLTNAAFDLLDSVFADWSETIEYNEHYAHERDPSDRESDAHDMQCVNAMAEQFPPVFTQSVTFSGSLALECLGEAIEWLSRLWWETKNEWDAECLADYYMSTPDAAVSLIKAYKNAATH